MFVIFYVIDDYKDTFVKNNETGIAMEKQKTQTIVGVAASNKSGHIQYAQAISVLLLPTFCDITV